APRLLYHTSHQHPNELMLRLNSGRAPGGKPLMARVLGSFMLGAPIERTAGRACSRPGSTAQVTLSPLRDKFRAAESCWKQLSPALAVIDDSPRCQPLYEYDQKREFRGTRMNESGQTPFTDDPTVADPQPLAAAVPPVREVPTALLGAAYLVVYVFLDFISSTDVQDPFVTYSWNPNTGASIAVALMFGRRMIPFMFIAPLISDVVVRQFPFPLPLELASAVLIGGAYGAAILFLLHPKQRFDRTLQSTYSLFLLTLTPT